MFCAFCFFSFRYIETDPEGGGRSKSKRVRTTFTEEQLHVLQANFLLDSNPDGQDLERIANLTGLSKRVTQVWFQNMRARHKKHLSTSNNSGSNNNNNNINNTNNNNNGAPVNKGGRRNNPGNVSIVFERPTRILRSLSKREKKLVVERFSLARHHRMLVYRVIPLTLR